MRILCVTQQYRPELCAPAERFGQLADGLAARGHQVTVLTTFPHFPRGGLHTGWRQRAWLDTTEGAVRVVRTPLLAIEGATVVPKAVGYLSFAASALLQAGLRTWRPEVVVSTSPPPTAALAGAMLARRFRAPHVVDVRDLWPEAVVQAGRVRPSVLMAGLDGATQGVLRRAAAVTTVSAGKRLRLLEQGAAAGRVHLLPHSVDVDAVVRTGQHHRGRARALLAAAGVPADARVVLFAGVLNPAQGLDVALDAWDLLRHSGRYGLHLVLAGDGLAADTLRARALGSRNVTFCGPVPREIVLGLHACAWAALVTLRPRGDTHTVPSKIAEAMAAGVPVLLSADGEAADLVRSAGCGLVARAGDAGNLHDVVLALHADDALARRYGVAGQTHARTHLGAEGSLDAWERLLTRVIGGFG